MNTHEHVPHAHCLLIVDCNRDYADSLGEWLRLASDWDVEVAYGPADALAQARQHRPDAVLLDPGMSGFDTADSLRDALRDKPPRLIAVTGNSNLQDEASHDARFAGSFLKPADTTLLLAVLTDPGEPPYPAR